MDVSRATNEYGVSPMTFNDRIAGRVIHGTNIGCKPYLYVGEEKELVDFLVTSSKLGFRKTRIEVLKIVEADVAKIGISVNVSSDW